MSEANLQDGGDDLQIAAAVDAVLGLAERHGGRIAAKR